MLAGDPTLRSKSNKYPGICHRCLQKGDRVSGGSGAPCDSKDTAEFPNKPCPGGIRATIIFPSCWDGKNVDSPVRNVPITTFSDSHLRNSLVV